MGKGRYQKKKSSGNMTKWLIAAALAVAALLVVLLCIVGFQNETAIPAEEQADGATNAAAELADGERTATDSMITTEPIAEAIDGPAKETTGDANEKPDVEVTEPVPVETVTPFTIELVQKAEAEYEKWLAAAMVVGVSMEYPDFEFNAIYTASATSMVEKQSSEGVYILFTSGGTLMAIHSTALAAERTAAGTKDISTEALGFATFDLVDPAAVKTDSMTEIKVEELDELIAQSMLVSIYAH